MVVFYLRDSPEENWERTSVTSVHKTAQELELIAKIEPVLVHMGYGLRDLEIIGSKSNAIVRVTLEKPGARIGIEDCAKVHRDIGPLFDVWDPFPGHYTLEVSSPGESPNLRTREHFSESIGARVEFETLEPMPVPPPAKPRRRWSGLLENVADQSIELRDQGHLFEVPFSMIKAAKRIQAWTKGDQIS